MTIDDRFLKSVLIGALRFFAIAVVFGWLYAWASPRMFPRAATPAFGYGFVHGALMPMALPSLVMGMEVEIFAANNSGRSYKLGYITGINICGLVFFGSAFWKPKSRATSSSSPPPGNGPTPAAK